MKLSTGDSQAWYQVAFGADYLQRYAHRDQEEARQAVELLHRHAPVRDDAVVLDLCCGAGRHLSVLDDPGHYVIGGDLSMALLREARRAGPPVVRLDMRRLPFGDARFDLVTNFFTAFGYFHSDEENFYVLSEIRRILRPGGWFLLDFLNVTIASSKIAAAPPEEVLGEDGALWKTTRRMTDDGKRGEKLLERIEAGRVVESIRESVRFFTRKELTGAMSERGLEPVHVWGNYDGSSFDEGTSPRVLILCRG